MRVAVLVFLLLFGGDLPDSAGSFSETEIERVQEASREAITEYIAAWEAGRNVEPLLITVNPTIYDPSLGGTNCNADCEHIGASHLQMRVEDWYDRGLACPLEIPRNSVLVFQPRYFAAPIARTCVDGGSAIIIRDDGVVRIDMLTQYPVWREDYSAVLYLPGMEVPEIPIPRLPVPDLPNRPDFACPVGNCSWDRILIQDVTEAHHGADLWTGLGGEVVAPAFALVTFAGQDNGCGGSVRLDFGGEWAARLCHISFVEGVEAGHRVRAGQVLGYVNNSGLTEDGGHLHFELYYRGRPLNVLDYVV